MLPAYPEILTEANWQKKKGALAKTAGETGVGAAMKLLKGAYDGVDQEAFLVKMAYKSVVELEEHTETARTALAVVQKVMFHAERVAKLATEAAKKFTSKPLIPKASAAHATAVKTAAFKFMKDLDIDPWTEFEKARIKMVATQHNLEMAALTGVKKAENAVNALDKANVTYDEWATFIAGPLRSLQVVLLNVPNLKASPASKIVYTMCQDKFKGLKGDLDSTGIRQKVAQVKLALSKVKEITG